MDYIAKINELRSVSIEIDSLIVNQSWRVKYSNEEEPDNQTILNECYLIIFDELRTLGIYVDMDISDALQDYYTADGFVALRLFLDGDTLTEHFKRYPEVQIKFESLLDTSDINDEDYFAGFYNLYKTCFPRKPEYLTIARIEDTIYSTNEFKNHILGVLRDAVPSSTIVTEYDVDFLKTYVEKIIAGQKIFDFVVKLIWDNIPDINKIQLQRDIDTYDFEKVQPANIKKYSWAVMHENDDALTEEEKTLQEKILLHHKQANPHHIEYYLVRQEKPNKTSMVELVCHHAEIGTDKEKFIQEVKDMITQGEGLLDDSDIQFLYFVANQVIKAYFNIPENYAKFNDDPAYQFNFDLNTDPYTGE